MPKSHCYRYRDVSPWPCLSGIIPLYIPPFTPSYNNSAPSARETAEFPRPEPRAEARGSRRKGNRFSEIQNQSAHTEKHCFLQDRRKAEAPASTTPAYHLSSYKKLTAKFPLRWSVRLQSSCFYRLPKGKARNRRFPSWK